MKGIIVINGYSKTEGIAYQVNRLTEEFNKLGVEIEVLKTNELICYIQNNSVKTEVQGDFVVYLDKDIHIAYMLQKYFRLFNSAYSIEVCDDKIKTHIMLSNCDIPMPNTISSPLMYYESEDNFVEKVTSVLDFPIVVKEAHGSLGKGVYLCNNLEELKLTRERLKLLPHLYQQFVSSSYGFDTRVIVVGGKVVCGYNRVSTSDFRSNLELGGTGEKVELTNDYILLAEKVAKILGLDYCGIDLLKGKNSPIVCEVNSNAFFTGAENITGVNVAKIYAEYIVNQINSV